MKEVFIRCSVFLVIVLSMVLLVGCGGLAEVPTVDDSETIVFHNGSPLIRILIFTLLALVGLFGVLLGIFVITSMAKDFGKKNNKLKGIGGILLFLLVPLGGVMMLSGPFYWWPYSERITIDSSSLTIEAEKQYFFRDETLRLSFDDISHVKFVKYIVKSQYSSTVNGKVILVLGDKKEVKLSHNGPKSQHRLAQRISEVTHKELIEE